MGGALVFISDNSLLGRVAIGLRLVEAALVLLLFGEVEIVIQRASVKPNAKVTGDSPAFVAKRPVD